jgi:ribonuclease HII
VPKKEAIKWLIGIDEAGRGPLAGPVTVGLFAVVATEASELQKIIFPKKIRDSKKLSESGREEILKKLTKLKRTEKICFFHAHISSVMIDRIGITGAIKIGIGRVLEKTIIDSNECEVRLDGLLTAPAVYQRQKTIIKGDETEVVIALSSIVAKVRRDRLMKRLALRYPAYDFGRHKGYGTRGHLLAIRQGGLSAIHRRTFCTKLA